MTRRKVSVEYIQNDKKRSTTYGKRKKGLLKKAYELATLCDVPLFMVIYPAGLNSAPVTYPEKKEEVAAVIKRYLSGSKEENAKRTLNLEQVVALANKKKKNLNSDPQPQPQPQQAYPTRYSALDGLNRDDLLNLASFLDYKLRQVEERMMMMRPSSSLFYNNTNASNALIPISAPPHALVNGGDHAMMMMEWHNASSSAYDPNSYLPDSYTLPFPHPGFLQSSSSSWTWT